MAITIQPPEYIGEHTISLKYSSSLGDPTFYIYLNGNFYAETDQESIHITMPPGEALTQVVIDVFDDSSSTPADTFPGRLTINWATVTGVDYYRIDQCIAAQWIEVGRVYDQGEPVFQWKSNYLEDVTTYVFRVMPVGTNANEGTALALDCLMVRYPDDPDPSYSYSDVTHKVTITI